MQISADFIQSSICYVNTNTLFANGVNGDVKVYTGANAVTLKVYFTIFTIAG